MRPVKAIAFSSAFTLVPLVMLTISWGLVWTLLAFSNALRQRVSQRSEADLVHSSVAGRFEAVDLHSVPEPKREAVSLVVIGALSIPLSRAWLVVGAKVVRRKRVQEITLKKTSDTGGAGTLGVVIRCYTLRRFEQPPPLSASDISAWVSPFFGSTRAFLAAYPAALSLFTATANARPGMLYLQWGQPRWRLDALLNLRLVLLPAEVVDIIRTSRLEAFLLHSRASGTPRKLPVVGWSNTGLVGHQHRFVFGAVLFNRAGQRRLASLRFNVTAARQSQALACVVHLLSGAKLVPWLATPIIFQKGINESAK